MTALARSVVIARDRSVRGFEFAALGVLVLDWAAKLAVLSLWPRAADEHYLAPAWSVSPLWSLLLAAAALSLCAYVLGGFVAVAAGVVLGGVLGNGLQRLDGPVTDFIRLRLWPHPWEVVNLADIAIVVGLVALGLGLVVRLARARVNSGSGRG